jgi:hypothetical protein
MADIKIHPPVEEDPYAHLYPEEEVADPIRVIEHADYDMRAQMTTQMHARHASTGLHGQVAVEAEPEFDEFGFQIGGPSVKAPKGENEAPRMVSPNDAASHEYRCPKCRHVLFGSNDVDATGDYGEASAQKSIAGKNWNKGGMPSLDDNVEATSLFLTGEVAEPLLGEEAYAGVDSGKLYCPGKNGKCMNKVGHFKWSGEQDNRGHFHAPSFNVPKSRVDCMPIVRALNVARAPAAAAAVELLDGDEV